MTLAVLVVGGGFTGSAIVREGAKDGVRVAATTRSESRAAGLRALGARALVAATLEPEALAAEVPPGSGVVVTMPPAPGLDERVAAALSGSPMVYVSSTAVYGAAEGIVDDTSVACPSSPRGTARLDAENVYRGAGAVVLRCPGIYGPGRGMHQRVARGEARIAGDGGHFISRIHVDDLARLILAALAALPRDASLRGRAFVVGDDAPAPQGEVVRWLAARLGLPTPESVPLETVDESLRGNRRVDNGVAKRTLGVTLRYASYREGFEACLREDGLV